MPRVTGNNIAIYKGETLPIEVTVYDSTGQLATNLAVAKFALRQGAAVTIRDANIQGAVVTIVLNQADSLALSGQYQYEFRVRDADGEVDSLIVGNLSVQQAPITTPI